MKKIILAIMAVFTMCFAGCKSIPTPEKLETTSYAIGIAAGHVANQVKITDETRNAVIEIMVRTSTVIPTEKQTFEDAWTPIAKNVISNLREKGRLDELQAMVVEGIVKIAVKALDYEFTVRYPKAKQYANLVSSAVNGFTGGFLSKFTPANMRATMVEMDKDAYDYLMKECR